MMIKEMAVTAEEEAIQTNRVRFLPKRLRRKDVTRRLFYKLQVGQFIVQVGSRYPLFVKSPTNTLDDRRAMSDEQWEAFTKRQLEKYYAPPFEYETTSESVIAKPMRDPFAVPLVENDTRTEKKPGTPPRAFRSGV